MTSNGEFMKSLSFLALILVTFSTLPTFAGAGSSGGGNALVCFDTPEIPKQIRERDQAGNIIDGAIRNEHIKHITRIEVLDLVEAKYSRGMSELKSPELIQIMEGEDVEDYTRRVIERVKNSAPELYDSLIETLNKIPSDLAVAQPDGLYPVDDYNLLGRHDSSNCVVATIALHQNEGHNGLNLYFDQRLMFHAKHSLHSRAITYLHEVVYAYARTRFQHTDSQNTRKVVGLLIRKDVSAEELQTTLKGSNMDSVLAYKYTGRTDRMGYLYSWINRHNDLLIESYYSINYPKEIKNYLERVASDLRSFTQVDGNDERYIGFAINDILNISNRTSFKKKEKIRIEEAKRLYSKYRNYKIDSEKYAQTLIESSLKKIVMENYISLQQKEFLEIPNVPYEQLKEIDNNILSNIENNMGVILKRVLANDSHIFKEAIVMINKIELQKKL